MLISARREGEFGLLVHLADLKSQLGATLFFETDGKDPFDDEYFEDAKEDIAEIVVTKFMQDTGKKFHELDIVVGFNAPEFDNLTLDFVDPAAETFPNTETT